MLSIIFSVNKKPRSLIIVFNVFRSCRSMFPMCLRSVLLAVSF